MRLKFSHPYHLVSNSPVPFLIAVLIFDLVISFLMIIYNKIFSVPFNVIIIINIIYIISLWIKEIKSEGFYKGEHTEIVNNNLLFGFILFVLSEILIFISLFFAYFYNSLVPSIEIGNEWPPLGISILDPLSIPLLNTVILYLSGITITISQNFSNLRSKVYTVNFFYITIFLGIIFSYLQYIEYFWASYDLTDSVYSTTFFILTGFHGIHVIIGTILLIISLYRVINNIYNYEKPVFLVSSIIYWHFVDYVWLLLYIGLYTWGS